MKKALASTTFILVSVLASFGQATCTRHQEPAGGFSYCPPSGWAPRDANSGPYKSFFTPDTLPYKGNINVKSEATSLAHDAYMALSLRTLLDGNESRGSEARKIIGWTKFSTDSGLTGSRMVYETVFQGTLVRTIQVILDLPDKKLLITGSALQANKDVTDKIFDGVARTVAQNR